jgi:hypothetical protein
MIFKNRKPQKVNNENFNPMKIKLGLLINFNEALLKNGIHRIINGRL